MDNQASLLPCGPDERDRCIAEAAALYRSWANTPKKERDMVLDLRPYLSRIANGGVEGDKQAPLCRNNGYLAMKRSTAVPAKKRKRDVSLTDSEEECFYDKRSRKSHPSVSADSETQSQSNDTSIQTTSSTMTTDQAPPPNLVKFLTLKWLVTARRGRKSLVSSTAKSTNGEDHSLMKRGNTLYELHTEHLAVTNKSAVVKETDSAKFAEQAIEAKPKAFFNGDQVVNMFSGGYKHPGDGSVAWKSIRSPISGNPDNQLMLPESLTVKQMLENVELYKQHMGMMNLQQKKVISSDNRFKCNECDKSFPSHQALGGHKTRHNKRNKSSPDLANGARPAEKNCAPLLMGDHRCKICDKSFPSGQALGGHQRLHYVVPSMAPTSATSILATSQGNAASKKLFDIDLNQPLELEAEGISS